MVDPVLGFLVGFIASVAGAVVLFQAWTRSPRLGAVRPRSRVEPAQLGPVGQLAHTAKTHGVAAFRDVIEQETRAQLFAWAHARGVPPAGIAEAAASGRLQLPPILLRVAMPGGEASWAREERLAGFRGPRAFFPVWVRFARLTESSEARTIRYLDALTRALQETVKP